MGAILTQNTSWSNVEKAIENLKRNGVLSASSLHKLRVEQLAEMIRPAGYFNLKAQRLKVFLGFLMNSCAGRIEKLSHEHTGTLRERLLALKGIGPETADSMLLYAFGKPVFVIDAYTKRVLSRHGIMDHRRSYEDFQDLFHSRMKRDVRVFNEYHALFVAVGKAYCKRRNPLCDECPLCDLLPAES